MPPTTPAPLITPEAIQRLLMQGGNPSSMFSADPSQSAPPSAQGGAPTAPPSGTLAQQVPAQGPAAPPTAPSTPTPTTPASPTQQGAPSQQIAADTFNGQAPQFQAPKSEAEFDAGKPDTTAYMPVRPVRDIDASSHPGLNRALRSLFAGLAEYGRPGEGAEMVNRWHNQDVSQRQYDANQPRLQAGALHQAYDQYLGESAKTADIENTEADVQNKLQNNPAMQRKAQFLTQLQGEAESGKYDPATLKAKYLRMAQFNHVNVAPEEIDSTIQGTKPLGSKYTLTRDPQTQAPIELVDRQGNHYSQSNLPKDPEAQQMWNDATTASGQKEQVEEGKEKRVADYAATRQAAAFTNQQTEQGRKAASTSIADINDAKNQQSMIESLLGGKMNPTSQTAAMFKMIGLEQPTGAHRIMPAEIEGIEQQGGLTDRLKQKLLNWKEGDRFDPDLIPDVVSTAKTLSQNKVKTANDNLESTAKIYGYKAPGSDAKGRFDKPEDYQPQQTTTQQGGGGQTATGPNGHKIKVVGGKWVDAATGQPIQ